MSHALSSSEGTLAPTMVSHRTPASSRSITGIPVLRLVSRRSSRRSRRAAASGSMSDALAAMAFARAMRAAARLSAQPPQSPGQAGKGRSGLGPGCRTVSSRTCRSSSSPLPPRAAAPTTGQPSSDASTSRSTRTPFFSASSSRFTQSAAGQAISRICSARARFRSRQVASATTSVTSASPPSR